MDVLVKDPLVVEQKRLDLSGAEDDHAKCEDDQLTQDGDSSKSFSQSLKDSNSKQVSNPHGSERSSSDTVSNPSSSSNPTELNINSKDELESTRAEMREVREENERLKSVLAKILEDYRSLKSQIDNSIQKDQGKTSCCSTDVKTSQLLNWAEEQEDEEEEEEEEGDDLVSLSLGTRSLIGQNNGEDNKPKVGSPKTIKGEMNLNEGLPVGLHLGFERSGTGTGTVAAIEQKSNYFSPDNSFEDQKDESQPSNKIPKSASPRSTDDLFSQQLHVKKARVSVRARCDAPTMSDGCQWRKYGQKISKGNPCPRAYYRCTVAPACPVRKQVQRCADDMSILITTYEGTHNHSLPTAATAMASTTSAAANMLMTGSSASRAGIATPMAMTPAMLNPALNGLNFNINSDNSSSVASSQPYYFQPNPNLVTASPHFSTITLDLTSPSSNPTPPLSSLSSSSTQFNRFSNYTSSTAPRYSTNFNFSSMDSTTITSHAAATQNYLGFGSLSMIPSQTPHEPFYYQQQPSSLQKPTITSLPSSGHTNSSSNGNHTDTIAEAITTDPRFQSVLAAAITSIVSGGNGKEGVVVSDGLTQNSKWGSSGFSTITSSGSNNTTGSNGNANGCTPSFLNRPTANPRMQGNMMFLGLSSMGFPNAKDTSSASHVESSEHMN